MKHPANTEQAYILEKIIVSVIQLVSSCSGQNISHSGRIHPHIIGNQQSGNDIYY